MRRKKGNIWRPCDLLIVGMVLALAALPLLPRGEEGKTVEIKVEGETVRRIPLDVPGDYTVPTGNGEIALRVADGAVAVVSSPCPDQTCVHTGARRERGEAIVCLPEQFVAEITGESEVDAYVG